MNDLLTPNSDTFASNPAEAAQEIKHWFKDDELMTYGMLHEKFTR